MRPTGREWLLLALYGLAWFGAYNVALNLAEHTLDAGTTAMIVNIGPILIALGAGVLLGEGVPRWLVIGALVAFLGVVIIGLASSVAVPGREIDLVGMLWALLAAVTYAAGVLAQKPVSRRIPAIQTTSVGCVVGAIATLPFVPDGPHEDRCGSCRACQDACPTQAFPHAYRLDARRCISYLTIEHDGPIPYEFREAMGNRIYGCDDCLAVCPWNKFAKSAATNRAFLPRAELSRPRLADLLQLDDAGFRALFSKSPIKRIGRDKFVRNCLIAAGNSGEPGLLAQVEPLRGDPDPVVAEAAEWAAERLMHYIPIPSSRT